MQDLDFEELDKAVNSLMPQTEAEDTTNAPVVTASPVAEPAATPAPTPVINTAPRPAVGRFMDVVHPSSDMRSSLNTPQRPAPTIPVAPAPIPVPAPAPKPVYGPPVQPSTPAADNWAGLPNFQTPSSAPESPFLSEAKVEKRPLGAFSNEVPTEVVEDKPAPAEPEKTAEAAPEKVDENKIPEELDSSVMGFEADSSTHPKNSAYASNPLSTSINQQYSEKPSSAKPETGSIYDTSSYYKAVTKKKKKKSGWSWVLWIFVLLVVGVGAGIAFYYFVMPNFPGLKLPF